MSRLTMITIICIAICSCKKNPVTPMPVPVPEPVNDAKSILLKDMLAQNLPAPYFHFAYDTSKFIIGISFADSLTIYDVKYENKRVKQMINTRNHNTVMYSYTGNNVTEINEYSGVTGSRIFRNALSYDNDDQLRQVTWYQYMDDPAGLAYKKATLTYHVDGNLAAIERYGLVGSELTWISIDEFSDYDGKTNVDDFSLMHDFFDTFLFLPRLKLQKSNPLKEKIKGTVNDFDITYTYIYQNNLPVKKTGIMTQTRGNGAGQSKQIGTSFTYY